MVNINVIVGRVGAVVPGERADILIVDDKSNPEYPQKVACEFYGDKNKKLLNGVGPGELVRVNGSARSREHNGKWFTTWSAYSIAKLEQRDSDPHGGADLF